MMKPTLTLIVLLLMVGGCGSSETKKESDNNMKQFKLNEFKELVTNRGGCIATDKITVDGLPVGYMYREEPVNDSDSGWRFFSGTESQEYVDDSSNSEFYALNTIANYDQSIIQYLDLPIGTELERIEGTDKFKGVE